MKCFTPQIDYFEQDVFDSLSFSQIVEVGNTFYLSGIAPLKGSLENTLVMGQCIEEQLEFILTTAGVWSVLDWVFQILQIGRFTLRILMLLQISQERF